MISFLSDKLAPLNFFPAFGQEINAVSGEKKQILIMNNFSENIKIEFPTHGVIISCVGMLYEDFLTKTKDVLTVLRSCFPSKKSNRIAFLNSKIYGADEETYNSLYRKLFTYHAVEPFEWENRIALRKKVENYDEEVNSISIIRRGEVIASFLNGGQPTDCAIFDTDTNTLPQNGIMRFTWDNALDLADKLGSDNQDNMKKIERYASL